MVVSCIVKEIEARLRDNARFEAEQIVMNALGLTRSEFILSGKKEVTEAEYKKAEEMARRRENGEPLQYILGETEFMSLAFYVDRGVLIPRPDTETLVESLLEDIPMNKNLEVIDICAGSGCIGISLAHYRPDLNVCLVDISEAALSTSARNAGRVGVSERVKTLRLDILKECPDKKYDIIVSNPPYIETDVIDTLQTEVRDYEPRIALDGGEDGLIFYRRIIEIAPRILKENGILAFETGYNQGETVKHMMSGFDNVRIIKDLCGNDRVVKGIRRT